MLTIAVIVDDSMREYILTELERNMVTSYLKDGTKTRDFDVLLFRIRKSHQRLKEDMKLLESVLEEEKSQI